MKKTPHPVDVHVGLQLRAKRKELGVSQERLAAMIGLTFQQVQKYESGANRISCSRLWEIADRLGVSVGYFFEGLQGAGQASERTKRKQLFLATDDGQRIVKAMCEMRSPSLRRKLANVVAEIAEMEGNHVPRR